ncbi:ribosomal biogenesis factor [Antechinus flavipes]|uniref:ribosomal biogenesis factor n=1 Tax=Antechinus flavipes TaxID=38775 RepID=UPI0022361325|nr:ribosomal biogenesis factor [Antechinus flavipes]XP_051825924.1 ribosomal biogenesis factor [Antechinus flavipes]XP_051825926.1 ribosomal biogenesis factor [Antechinus flavipes]
MGKNKGKGQKIKDVFHIAKKNLKAKNKAKPVTTNLKKINIVNEEKVRTVNKAFIDIQKELAHFSKRLSLEPDHLCSSSETITVDDATRLMAQL